MITSIRNAALTLAAASMVASPVAANVGDSMDRFMDDMGAAANVIGPTAFEGQSAGYYSLGNVWTRFPQKTTNVANLQLPRARAGCGGIDIFAGSFSFINASEMVALLKAVANNAVGFAFSLAIDTVCPECNKIMQEFSQKAQLMNNLSINSCEMAQGLVGGLWPKGDLADKAICEAIGNSEGIFTDYAAAKHGCGTRGQRASTNEGAGADYADINPGVARNYTWHVLKKSAFFNPGGNEEGLELAKSKGATVIAMEMVPRISRAQKMDALSSMANIAGYRAVIEAANNFPRLMTGQVTAAGKVAPARVLVVGAGVAGLAAIGTSTSLGAITYAFDVRPEVAEQIESILTNPEGALQMAQAALSVGKPDAPGDLADMVAALAEKGRKT